MWLQPQFGRLTLGPVRSHKNLTVAPLLGHSAIQDDLLLADEASHTGYFTAEDSGRLDTLWVENRLETSVFIPSGQLFEGDTQNRAARFPVVTGPRSGRLPLFVRCTEEGQPLLAGEKLKPSRAILVASARTGRTSQEGVWQSISHTLRHSSVRNPTNDYALGMRDAPLDEYLAFLGGPAPERRGYVAAVRDGADVAFFCDVLGSCELYSSLHDPLMKSIAAEAMAAHREPSPGPIPAVSRNDLFSFMTEIGQMKLETKPLRAGFIGVICIGHGGTNVAALMRSDVPVQISAGTPREPSTGSELGQTMF